MQRDAVYANRRLIRGERGKRLLRKRGELVEHSFAHSYETGGMRRAHLRGHGNILKRLLIHVGASNFGDLPDGSSSSQANAVSTDGSVVVGDGAVLIGGEAFIWDATNDMRNLRYVLVNNLDLTGWTLALASGISDDGLTIVGTGNNSAGFTEAWIATLPPAILGDIAGDGMVRVTDLLDLLGAWGVCSLSCPTDFDDSGTVDIQDLLTLLANWT